MNIFSIFLYQYKTHNIIYIYMNPSLTLLAKQIKIYRKKDNLPIYDFGLGENPMPVSSTITNSIKKNCEYKEYTNCKGIDTLKNILGDKILIGNGLKPLIFNLQLSFSKLYPNGTIIYISPSWCSYKEQTDILGINTKTVYPSKSNWKITVKDLEDILKQSSKDNLVFFNNPNNPSGCIYTKKEVKEYSTIFKKYNSIVFFDGIYNEIVHPSYENDYGDLRKYYDKIIFGSSLSKTFASGGYRFGWLIFPKNDLIKLYDICHILASSIYSCPTNFLQYVAVDCLKYSDDIKENMLFQNNMFETIAKYCKKEFKKMKLTYSDCRGAWYFLIDFNNYSNKLKNINIYNSGDLCKYLANTFGIITVSGDAFNIRKNYVLRFSIVDIKDINIKENKYNFNNIKNGLKILKLFLDRI